VPDPPGTDLDGKNEGVTVVITRALEQSGDMKKALEGLGVRVILSPAIRFADPLDWSPVDDAIRQIGTYDIVIFTSTNGVRAYFSRMRFLGIEGTGAPWPKIVAVGSATQAALEERSIQVNLVPEEFRAEGILSALGEENLHGKRILILRAEKGRAILPRTLSQLGAEVNLVTVYRTLPGVASPEAVELLTQVPSPRLVITFTSGSTVEHFLASLPAAARKGMRASTVAVIGPITSACLTEKGIQSNLLPSESTIPALIHAIAVRFNLQPVNG
jgi:uroporphyrinogen III methyltransferase/synthase